RYESERESRREGTVFDLQSFRQRQIFGIARKGKRVEIERDVRFLGVGERCRGFTRESKSCAVDCAVEARRDADLRIVGKARQKRDADSEIRYRDASTMWPVVEKKRSIVDLDVVERKLRRRPFRTRKHP